MYQSFFSVSSETLVFIGAGATKALGMPQTSDQTDVFRALSNAKTAIEVKKELSEYLFFFDLLSDDVFGKRAFCDGHSFNLDGGGLFSKMGATWFVSYSYYQIIDKKHENWSLISTCGSRASVYDRTKKYHKFWLKQVLRMNDGLSTNEIGVPPAETKRMAKEILVKVL